MTTVQIPFWLAMEAKRELERIVEEGDDEEMTTRLIKAPSTFEECMDSVVDDWRLSTAAPHRKKNGRPYADSNPDDPGVVVRWTSDGNQYAVACDHYTKLRDNIRAIGLYIREKRKMDKRPVKTGQSEFATARLPPGDEEKADSEAIAVEPTKEPHEVLGVAPNASEAVIKGAVRELKKETHPDNGGSAEELKRVLAAEKELLGEGGR